ncbi:MAG: AsmA family protein, partial [Flavisolibacter sp.]
MKHTRKILKIVGISLSVLLILLMVLPLIFRNQIIAGIKSGINQNINAVVDFKDADVSLLRRFPKLSVRLEDVSVVGNGSFSKDSLLSSKTVDASLNLFSLFEDEMQIYAVEFGSPRIHALINKDGLANWDIAKADTSTSTDTSSSTFKMNLEHYSIEDGYVFYKDEQGGMSAEVYGLNHEGSGSFTDEIFTLSTTTSSDGASFTYEGIPYLSKAKTNIESDILVDTKTGKYSFNNSELQLNNLKVKANGFFQLLNDSTYNMDIAFKSPSTDFKDVISLIPLVYQRDFEKVKTSGKAI